LTHINAQAVQPQWNPIFFTEARSIAMKAMVDLFSTDYGLLSVAVLAFILVMAGWFYRFFTRKMNEPARDPEI
jgi:hypothetical protein